MNRSIFIVALLVLVAGVFTAACSGASQTTTPSQPSGPTAEQLASAGKTVYTSRCAGCHGDSGQGVRAPAIIGTGASLGKYNTAQGLLNFVSTVMPANNPGSLSQQDNLDVVTYLLVQNNFVSTGAVLETSHLDSIRLNK